MTPSSSAERSFLMGSDNGTSDISSSKLRQQAVAATLSDAAAALSHSNKRRQVAAAAHHQLSDALTQATTLFAAQRASTTSRPRHSRPTVLPPVHSSGLTLDSVLLDLAQARSLAYLSRTAAASAAASAAAAAATNHSVAPAPLFGETIAPSIGSISRMAALNHLEIRQRQARILEQGLRLLAYPSDTALLGGVPAAASNNVAESSNLAAVVADAADKVARCDNTRPRLLNPSSIPNNGIGESLSLERILAQIPATEKPLKRAKSNDSHKNSDEDLCQEEGTAFTKRRSFVAALKNKSSAVKDHFKANPPPAAVDQAGYTKRQTSVVTTGRTSIEDYKSILSKPTSVAPTNKNSPVPSCVACVEPNQEDPFPLGIYEDQNWLSEFQCFVRSELIEVFIAREKDVEARRMSTKKIVHHQVGIRCKFCARIGMQSGVTVRASAFPSKISRIYQSFAMMIRDHFSDCVSIPGPYRKKFAELNSQGIHGSPDSKKYWMYAAHKIGMVDEEDGIALKKQPAATLRDVVAYGTNWEEDAAYMKNQFSGDSLVSEEDKELSSFLYNVVSHLQRVTLLPSERRGNRRSLEVGLPGFACRYCCQIGWVGQCRQFPAKKRKLPDKIFEIYVHLLRCKLCPEETKTKLLSLQSQQTARSHISNNDRLFYDLLWERLSKEEDERKSGSRKRKFETEED